MSFSKFSKLLLIAFFITTFGANKVTLAHGSHGNDERPDEGQFKASKSITIEGHGGLENNLEGSPKHYGVDAAFNYLMQWGLKNNGVFSIETGLGLASVFGEAEHFYGIVHAHDDHDDHDDDHDEDHDDDHDDHDEDHEDHDDDHDDHDEDHDDHDHHSHHGNTDYKRIDFKGLINAKFSPNDRLDFDIIWKPYLVTKDQGEEKKGLKNELKAKAKYSFGDGDVNFALGDSFQEIIEGTYVYIQHNQGWESDGKYIGNFTDARLGVSFNYDLISLKFDAGPRFYNPGNYSELNPRTDFASEIEISRPLGSESGTTAFIHWEPTYSSDNSEGWGKGWSHHIGAGISFSF